MKISRPSFPSGYLLDTPQQFVSWDVVEAKLYAAKNVWLGTVRPNGKPHTVPKWAVYVRGRLFFDGSPETRHARNLAKNPFVTLHLESGDDVVIVEGRCVAVQTPSAELAQEIAASYTHKYAQFGYSPEPNQWDDGGLFEIVPYTILAWTQFNRDPTKFTFAHEE